MALRYCFEQSRVARTLAKSKPHNLAVIDTDGMEEAVGNAVKRGVCVYGYFNVGALFQAPLLSTLHEWRQSDSTNPYMMGDRVTYNGKTYESTIDNNVWSPDVYGWTEVE